MLHEGELLLAVNWIRKGRRQDNVLCVVCVQMRIPSDQFDTVAVSEVSYGEKLEQQHHHLQQQQQQQPSPGSSLFSGFQLKLPQFRMKSPNGTNSGQCHESESTPSSPMFGRRDTDRRKQTLAQPPQKFLHQALSRHQSLSTNNTPARFVSSSSSFCYRRFPFFFLKRRRRGWRNATTPLHRLGRWWTSIHSDSFYRKLLSAQASIGPTQPNRKTSSGSDCYVCRDCQLLIENIIYNPVPTVHCDRPSIHVSLPWSIPPPPPTQLLLRLNNQTVNWMNEHKTNKKWLIENDGK